MTKNKFEFNIEQLVGEPIEVIRKRPLSEVHDKIRQANGGSIPYQLPQLCKGHPLPLVTHDEAERQYKSLEIPWYKGVRRIYSRFFR